MLPAWAKKYIGRPYEENGCYKFVREILENEFNVFPPNYQIEDANKSGAFAHGLTDDCWFAVATPRCGDVVLLKLNGLPLHCGLVVEPGRMLHVMCDGSCSCVERYDSPRWANRVAGFYRHCELAKTKES